MLGKKNINYSALGESRRIKSNNNKVTKVGIKLEKSNSEATFGAKASSLGCEKFAVAHFGSSEDGQVASPVKERIEVEDLLSSLTN